VQCADEWNETAAAWLAQHPEVSLARIYRGLGTGLVVYRFTLPTGVDLDWDPGDGWDGTSSAIDAIVEWLSGESDDAPFTASELLGLVRNAQDDTDRVSMLTLGDNEDTSELSVVVIKGRAEIEMFRQWAERNRLFTRGKGIR
jgi:hypothetical protein